VKQSPATADVVSALATLLVCQLAGEIVTRALGLPIAGPVLGMLLLFAYLLVRGGPSPGLERTSLGLLDYLAMLFVPAGVGAVRYLDVLGQHWLAIAIAVVGSTFAAIAVTGWTMNGVEAFVNRRSNAG
jgi:putative effector of murein hydrolase LrgA (UPF0299 family)